MRLQIVDKRMEGKRSGSIMEILAVGVRVRYSEKGNAKIIRLKTGISKRC